MKSVWSDGKTRVHKVRCLRCDAETDAHQSKLSYIESSHFDAFASMDDDLDYDEWRERFEQFRILTVNTAFSEGPWELARIRETPNDKFALHVYAEEPEGDWPYGQADVSWSAENLYLNDAEVGMIDLNGGTADLVLRGVVDAKVCADGANLWVEL